MPSWVPTPDSVRSIVASVALLSLPFLAPVAAQQSPAAAPDPGPRASSGTRWLEGPGVAIKVLIEASNLGGSDVEVAELTLQPGGSAATHKHGSAELIYVLEGVLDHVVNGETHRLEPGMVGIASPEARLVKLRAAVAGAPDDPEGTLRLVRLLAEAGHTGEALQQARRLADLGLMTPSIARALGDLLADQGNVDEAVRAYSEIVEFDPASPAQRRELGDIYLAHEWYGPAYRQFLTLTEKDSTRGVANDPLAELRLAIAAAGDGRVDEALRIERSVAESEGTPGPSDPRRFARLWSAARLARLLQAPPAANDGVSTAELTESVTRKLKELQLFRGSGRYVLVTWQDLGAGVVVTTTVDGKNGAAGEATDAGAVGLYGLLLPAGEDVQLTAHLTSPPRDHALQLAVHEITSDGKTFQVKETSLKLKAGDTALAL